MTIRKVLALLLILAILVAGGLYILNTERADNDRMKNLYAEVEPLERQRAELISERNSLESEYALKFRDYATIEILFTALDAQIISDVYPVMRDRDVVGVLGFSYKEFPTYYNKLTPDDCLRLIGDGWGTCLLYEQGWGSFTSWYEGICRSLASYNIPAPTAVYFSSESNYTEMMDAELISCGIKTVITNSADGRSNTVTDVTGALWHTGAMPWNYTGSATDTELLGRTDGANLCFTMKLSEVWDLTNAVNKNKKTIEEAETFKAVLDSWKDMLYSENPLDELESVGPTPSIYLDANDTQLVHDTMQEMYLNSLTPEQQLLLPYFRSANFDTALQYHRDALNNNSNMQMEMDQRREELDAQITALDTQISEIYVRWGVSQSTSKITTGGQS